MSPAPWMIVSATVDPAVRAEFDRWLVAVHLPHVLAIPGISGARRLRVAAAHSTYTAVYTFTDDAAVQQALGSPQAQTARGDWERWQAHIRDLTVRFYAEAQPSRVLFRDN